MDPFITALLFPLALAILISGLDDLFVDAVWLRSWLARDPRRRLPRDAELSSIPEKKIAVLIPMWQEHGVIRGMLEHNLAACHYGEWQFFAAGYPNDEKTLDAVHEVAARHDRVHLGVCPHDGPTSKADCLNWAFERLLLWEAQHGERFDVVMVHDAEDLMHPESLRVVNYYAERFDMVQIPVLALPTPLREPLHGLYCDEFAQYQTRDMTVRSWMRAFVPSTGVGMGIRREAVERLLASDANRLFAPESLTEDYELGFRLKELGCSQVFVPVTMRDGSPLATREYFPRRWGAALRQRTRWLTGIGLQSWQRHGWRGEPADRYWLWRDRKGLIGHPLSALANAVTAYGLFHWNVIASAPATAKRLMAAAAAMQLVRFAVRFGCVRRIYGARFALGIPVRAVIGNVLSTSATASAVVRFAWARAHGRPLRWLKTDHAYPARAALALHKRRLGEVLAGSGFVSQREIDLALLRRPDGLRLGEYLMRTGAIDEDQLYLALGRQHGLPPGPEHPREVRPALTRILPAYVSTTWRLLPFDADAGRLRIAVDDVPAEELLPLIRRFTHLEPEFHLIPPSRLDALRMALAV